MPSPARTALVLFLALLPAAGGAPAGREGAADVVRELHVERGGPSRAEHFVLEDEAGRALGLVRLFAGSEAADAAGEGLYLEAEHLFFDEDTRVLHAERHLPALVPGRGPRSSLVWREMRPRSGRTVVAEGSVGAPFRSRETSGEHLVRRVHEGAHGSLFPLALLEAARRGEPLAGTYDVFQPLSSSLEAVTVEAFERAGPEGPERVVELRREDGGSAGRYVFRGEDLVSFRLQAGGPRARLVSRGDYEKLRAGRVQRGAAPLSAPDAEPR